MEYILSSSQVKEILEYWEMHSTDSAKYWPYEMATTSATWDNSDWLYGTWNQLDLVDPLATRSFAEKPNEVDAEEIIEELLEDLDSIL